MEFRILGPLEVRRNGQPLALGGAQQRALLALLLIHRGEVVSTDRLIDELWGEGAPPTAAKTVQGYVSQLRKVLGEGVILTRGRGYQLTAAPGDVDLDRFERLCGEGREELAGGNPHAARQLLEQALSLWHGAPLAEFAYERFAQSEISRLDELRLAAAEEQIDADLALGRHGEVIGELQALVRDSPLRERPLAQLMLALYRCGRQAEALEAYRNGRRVLNEKLGLEPGPELRALEQAILDHDQTLLAPPRQPAVTHRRSASRVSRAALLIAGGALLLLLAAVGAVLLSLGKGRSVTLDNAAVAIDGGSGRVLSYVPVGISPTDVAVGEGGIWVLNADDRTVSRIDPRTRQVTKTFAIGGLPTELAVGDGAVWVGSGTSTAPGLGGIVYTSSISRLDPRSPAIQQTIKLPVSKALCPCTPPGVSAIAVGPGAVWAINPDQTVSRIDPRTGHIVAVVAVPNADAVAVGAEGVWVGRGDSAVTQIDPVTNRPGQTIRVAATTLAGIALGAGSVWASDPIDGTVWRIDPGPQPVTRTVSVSPGTTDIAFGGGSVWTSNFITGTSSRISPATNALTLTRSLAGTPQGIAVAGGTVWVSVAGGSRRGSLPASACGPVESGGHRPDLLIASDLPLQGTAVTRTIADAVRLVLAQHGFRAGKYTVGYQSCDDSTAQVGNFDFFKCGANAKAYAEAAQLVAVIGPYNSSCAQVEIPIASRATSGPVPMISPSTTNAVLTHTAAGALASYTSSLYPTGVRNFLRLAAPEDRHGAGQALLATELGARRIYLLDDGYPYGQQITFGELAAAPKLGLSIAGSAKWGPSSSGYPALAARVASTHPEAVLLGGSGPGGALVKALRQRLDPQVALIAPDGFLPVADLLQTAGRAAIGMYISISGASSQLLPPAGRRFMHALAASEPSSVIPAGTTYVPEAAQAAEVVLAAIARSNGTRPSVLQQLRATHLSNGILGSFGFDPSGDMTEAPVSFFRVTGGAGGRALLSDYRGSVPFRVIYVPAGLVR